MAKCVVWQYKTWFVERQDVLARQDHCCGKTSGNPRRGAAEGRLLYATYGAKCWAGRFMQNTGDGRFMQNAGAGRFMYHMVQNAGPAVSWKILGTMFLHARTVVMYTSTVISA
jgi:hypothetical protein